MESHSRAGRRTKRNLKKLAGISKLIHDYMTIQFEIFQHIDNAFLMNSSVLREKLPRMLFLSLLQQTHIKTIKLSGKRDSEPLSDIPYSDTKCPKTICPSPQTFSCDSTETTLRLRSKPSRATSHKRKDRTYRKNSSKDLRE